MRSIHALAVLISTGAATAVSSGEVLIFQNTAPEFPWEARNATLASTMPGQPLDIRLSSSSQPVAQSPQCLLYNYSPEMASGRGGDEIRKLVATNTLNDTMIALGDPVIIQHQTAGTTRTYNPAKVFEPGDTIGPGLNYARVADVYTRWIGGGTNNRPLLGDHAFIGIQLTLPDGVHYGWLELELRGYPTNPDFLRYWALAWAYETEPGVPIHFPLPCPADLDGDGFVGASDLASLLGSWGSAGPADLVAPFGVTDSVDLAFMLGSWGPCP